MKKFIQVIDGDELFYIKLTNSKIVTGENGVLMKTKVKNIIRTCDMDRASFAIVKPEGIYSTITVGLNESIYVSYRTQDEITLDAEIYGTDQKEMFDKAISIVNSRLAQIDAVKRKCDENIDELLIAATVLEVEQKRSSNEVSLEEAASMAL